MRTPGTRAGESFTAHDHLRVSDNTELALQDHLLVAQVKPVVIDVSY
ncbi:hypothetical protein [Streptomyces sp. NPDC004592]